MLYSFTENFILPLSHDEVVHGKGSLLSKMPGDSWQKFANLRTYLTFMYMMSGKKLLFMGIEIGQGDEWDHNHSLDWHLLEYPLQKGIQTLVRDLNHLYRSHPALYELDCLPEGFSWIDCHDSDNSVISFIRRGKNPDDFVAIICNFTPVVRDGVPDRRSEGRCLRGNPQHRRGVLRGQRRRQRGPGRNPSSRKRSAIRSRST